MGQQKRVRLTARTKNAADDKTPFPGDVGNENRVDPTSKQYDNYEELPGWELQEHGDPAANDLRDDIGFSVQNGFQDGFNRNDSTAANPGTVASQKRAASIMKIRQAAAKSVKLAVLLLGDKCNEKIIEAQARDFMRLGNQCLDASLDRYAKTEKLYSEEETKEETPAKKSEEETKTETPVVASKKAEEETKEETPAKKSEEETKTETPVVASKKAEEDTKEETPAKKSEEETKEETPAKKSEEETKTETPVKASKKTKSQDNELDIELSSPEEDVELSAEDEEMLTGLYSEDEEIPSIPTTASKKAEEDTKEETPAKKSEEETKEETPVVASKKAGVKSLGGQPKVASTGSELNLSELWKSAPDVSDIFN